LSSSSEHQPAPLPSGLHTVPGFVCVDHVAIAVKAGELDAQAAAYRSLGFAEIHREEVLGTDQVREVLLRIGDGPNLVQLLEPLTADSPVQKLIDRNGGRGGFAHLAFRVTDIQAAFDRMKASGIAIIDQAPRKGSRGTTVFFVHPKAFGYLVEVVEEGRL
jgi:methylmalonyl-CoA/ethylmalonyl-CoA epimerase